MPHASHPTPLVTTCPLPLQPEAFEKKGRALPSPPRAWAPRDNGKFDVIGQLPPMRNIPAIPALPGAFGGGSSVAAAAGGL